MTVAADLTNIANEVFFPTIRFVYDRNLVVYTLANTLIEGQMQGAEIAHYPLDTSSYTVTGDRTNWNWPNAERVTMKGQPVTWGPIRGISHTLDPDTQARTSADLLAWAAARQARAVAEDTDRYALGIFNGTDLRFVDDRHGLIDRSTAAGNSTRNMLVGGATNYLGADGEVKGGSTDKDIVYNALDELRFTLQKRDYIGPSGSRDTRMDITMGVIPFRNLQSTIKGLGTDQLIMEGLAGNQRTTLWGLFDIRVTTLADNTLNIHPTTGALSGSGRKQHYPIYATTTAAATRGQQFGQPQILSPIENQAEEAKGGGYRWLFRMVWQQYFTVVDARNLWRLAIRAEA